MSVLPLGVGAYRRVAGNTPEVKCLNRFVEQAPTNQVEQTMLLARPGTTLLDNFPADTPSGVVRGCYSKDGIFNSDLFVVSGKNFYRYDGETRTQISGEVQGSAAPKVDWVKGAGYERLFIADGLLLQYYDGGSQAEGTLTDSGAAVYAGETITINGTYYGWDAADVDAGDPDGSLANPFLCLKGVDAEESLENMANMLNFIGTLGVDFSSALTSANLDVSAASTATTLVVTAHSHFADGNDITTTSSDAELTWGAATLSGGGVHSLFGVEMPDGSGAGAVASLDSFVLVSSVNSRRFYFVRPGEVTIEPLDFFAKESGPDPILDMQRVGDVMVIMGSASTEFWSSTGQSASPFAPVRGRTVSRGIIDGTAVPVDESTIIVVGNDYRVYAVGARPQPISDHGIEERIRRQIRREKGLL